MVGLVERGYREVERAWRSIVERQVLFRDRVEAGALLAGALTQYAGADTLVLGIPRGGVALAAVVARRLGADLDVVVARKLGAPNAPELAIGAVTANGGCFLNDELIHDLRVSQSYLKAVTHDKMVEARRREERYRGDHPKSRIQDRMVIVVDDGLATGATMRAALRSVRSEKPARLVAAVPVGARESCGALRQEADDVVCLHQPEPFWAVGLHYENFEPEEDAHVQQILDQFHAQRRESRPVGSPLG